MIVLQIQKKWFDMILSGEKREEYREIKQYYSARLKNEGFLDRYGLPTIKEDWVLFRNGYGKEAPSFRALCTVDMRTGRREWGAKSGEEYFVFKILKVEK